MRARQVQPPASLEPTAPAPAGAPAPAPHIKNLVAIHPRLASIAMQAVIVIRCFFLVCFCFSHVLTIFAGDWGVRTRAVAAGVAGRAAVWSERLMLEVPSCRGEQSRRQTASRCWRFKES